jgi:hypothetical protein
MLNTRTLASTIPIATGTSQRINAPSAGLVGPNRPDLRLCQSILASDRKDSPDLLAGVFLRDAFRSPLRRFLYRTDRTVALELHFLPSGIVVIQRQRQSPRRRVFVHKRCRRGLLKVRQFSKLHGDTNHSVHGAERFRFKHDPALSVTGPKADLRSPRKLIGSISTAPWSVVDREIETVISEFSDERVECFRQHDSPIPLRLRKSNS